MFQLLAKPKYFYPFFIGIWGLVQLLSGNLFETFNQLETTPDVFSYIESCKILINGHYPWFRAVGYPLFLTPFYALGGFRFTAICLTIIQTCAWLATLRIVYKTLLIFNLKNKLAFIGSLTYALCISPLLNTNYLLTETFYQLLLLSSFYLFALWLTKSNNKYIPLIFILLPISALIRPVGMFIFYMSAVLVIFQWIKRGKKNLFLPWVLGFTIIIAHISAMKYNHGTTEMCLSKNYALYHYLYMKMEHYPELNATKYVDPFMKKSKVLQDSFKENPNKLIILDSIYKARSMNHFKANPYATLKTMMVNLKEEIPQGYGNNLTSASWVYAITKWQHIAIFMGFLFLPFVLLFKLFTSKVEQAKVWWIAIAIMISALMLVASSLVFWYKDRLHLPLYPLIIVSYFILLTPTKLNQKWA
jgi:hypothetical protein